MFANEYFDVKGSPFIKNNSESIDIILDPSNCLILNKTDLIRMRMDKSDNFKLKDQVSSFKELPINIDKNFGGSYEKWILIMQLDNYEYRQHFTTDKKSFHSFINNQALSSFGMVNLSLQNIDGTQKVFEKLICNLDTRDLKVVFSYEIFKNIVKQHLAPMNSQIFIQNVLDNCRNIQVLIYNIESLIKNIYFGRQGLKVGASSINY
jgi:hypothetical protein